jgi:hypothetical protein
MICIGFYCDIEPTSKIMVPRLVRTTLSTVLYKIYAYMKLFNIASPKFDERGGTNWEARLLLNYIKKKRMSPMQTLDMLFSVSVGDTSSLHLI